MTSHLLIEPLDYINSPRRSFGMRAGAQAHTIIFFIHGFKGSALGTWRQFDSLVVGNPDFEYCDLAFLGYDSIRTQTRFSAQLLLQSCRKVLDDASTFTGRQPGPKILQRQQRYKYQRVIFAAHSMGAIVTRRLLLLASADPWISSVELNLFAPAHLGATDVLKLATTVPAALGRLATAIAAVAQWKIVTLREVQTGSLTLSQLEKDTLKEISTRKAGHGPMGHIVARRVLFGEHEDIVDGNRFCSDPAETVYPGHDHVSICKPDTGYDAPLEIAR